MKLDLSEKQLTALPPPLDLSQVTDLQLSDNRFKSLPAAVVSMTQLRVLNLANNHLTHLPQGLSALEDLEELQLFDNKFETVPEAIFEMTQLRRLNLASNPISNLPRELSALKNLKVLNLYECPLTSIPDWVADFSKLEYLGFDNHEELAFVTPRLGEMASLKSLVVSGTYAGNDLGRYMERLTRVAGPTDTQRIQDFTLQYFRNSQAALDALETLEFGAVGGAAAFHRRVATVLADEETRKKFTGLKSAAELFIEADSFFADRAYEVSHEAELKEQLPDRRASLISGLEILRDDLEAAFPEVISPACYDADGRFRPEYLQYPHQVAIHLNSELEKAFRALQESPPA